MRLPMQCVISTNEEHHMGNEMMMDGGLQGSGIYVFALTVDHKGGKNIGPSLTRVQLPCILATREGSGHSEFVYLDAQGNAIPVVIEEEPVGQDPFIRPDPFTKPRSLLNMWKDRAMNDLLEKNGMPPAPVLPTPVLPTPVLPTQGMPGPTDEEDD